MLFTPTVEFIIILVFSLLLGSFATALAWRVPRGVSWAFSKKGEDAERSRCPHCQAILGVRDLVPLFSWICSKGRCRHCDEVIAARYPLIELLVMAGVVAVYLMWGLQVQSLVLMITIPFLVALLAIDIEKMILPDQLTLICGVMGLMFVALTGWRDGLWSTDLAAHVGGAVFAGFIYALVMWVMGQVIRLVLKKEALGFGDVKFLAVAGIWLGLSYLSVFFILSGVIGIFWGGAWRLLGKGPIFPFGPALILSFYVCLLLQKTGFTGFLAAY